jgi:hypothetical protein
MTKCEKSWKKILQDWPEQALHFLQQSQPELDPKHPWERVRAVGDITIASWHTGITLREIMETNEPAIWVESKMDIDTYTSFRNGRPMYIGGILEDYVVVVLCTKSMVEKYEILFHSADRMKMRIAAGLPLKMGYDMITPPPKKVLKYVHLYMTLPSMQYVQCFEGKGKILSQYESAQFLYHFMSEPSSNELIQIPEPIKFVWFHRQVTCLFDADFLDQKTYQQQGVGYANWSFENHQRMLKTILLQLDTSRTLIAPGDGIGIVASQWEGRCIAGDKYYSNDKVKKESFLETLVRGKREDPEGILVLSYVTSLMTEIELHSVNNWAGPVIWIDGSDQCPVHKMRQQTRNVWARDIEIIYCASLEHRTDRPWRRFTENLLALERICYLDVKGLAVKYWEQMRPMAKALQYDRCNPQGIPVVASTLAEYSDMYRERIKNIFFAPLGRVVAHPISVRLKGNNALDLREIYAVPYNSVHTIYLKKTFHWAVDEKLGTFYFCSTTPWDSTRRYEHKGEQVIIRMSASSQRLDQLVEVVSRTANTLILHTVYGLQSFEIRSQYQYWLWYRYLSEYGQKWKEKLGKCPGLPEGDNEIGVNWSQRIAVLQKEPFESPKRPHPFLFPDQWMGWINRSPFEGGLANMATGFVIGTTT